MITVLHYMYENLVNSQKVTAIKAASQGWIIQSILFHWSTE